ncbi:hypothetical protein Tsubulata_012084 [Turnera subulata]|uniref:Glycosyltransferase n=1 Tax=Turnera subulata TaxID=218843 RepID=A0A9Q0J0A8_9ROSI|nr:hypothetical protein Tsubulata_012084 [Turnera subulata]
MSEPKTDSNKLHIAVLVFPFATHAPPLLCLVRKLSAAAPAAQFSFISTAESNAKLFHKDPPSDATNKAIRPCNVSDGLPSNYQFSGNPQEPVHYFLKAAPDNFKLAMEVAVKETGRKISCLVSDAFFWFAADLAENLQVPWVPLWTSGPRALLLHVETDEIRRRIGSDGSGDKTIDFIPGFSAIHVSDFPEGIFCADQNAVFPMMLHKMGLNLPRAAAVASNSFAELDVEVVNMLKARLKNFLDVGPFILTSPESKVPDPHGCMEWLDKRKQENSVVYISFGSVITPPPQELAALAEGLEEGGFSFLWSFRGNPEEKLPKGFLDRTKESGKIVPWAPQLDVLKHKALGAFMTHCGWNSVSDAIVGCAPMICRPFFGDQQLNSRTVEAVWGIGLRIDGGKISKDGMVKALRLVLETEEGKKMRQKVESLQKLAISAAQVNGSSTENLKTLASIVTKSLS